jgi:hypothetical protein
VYCLPFEYERKVKVKGKDVWRKVEVFGTLKEMRESWLTRKDLEPNDPFRKIMVESIDLAIAGKIEHTEVFPTALSKYQELYGKQNLVLRRRKE